MYSAGYDKERPRQTPAVSERRVRRALVPARHSARRLRSVLAWIAAAWRTSTRSRASRPPRPTACSARPYVYPVAPAAEPRRLAGRAVPPRVAGHRLPGRQLARGGDQAPAAVQLVDRQLRLGGHGRPGLHAGRGREGSRRHGARNAAWPACCSTPTTTSSTASSRRRRSGAPDPAIDCRNYIIVYVTDGHDECSSDPCVGGTDRQRSRRRPRARCCCPRASRAAARPPTRSTRACASRASRSTSSA